MRQKIFVPCKMKNLIQQIKKLYKILTASNAKSQVIKRKTSKQNERNSFVFAVQSNYEPLNRNNDCIGQWSWYYRGCWHQTCPPLEIQIHEQ